MLGTHRLLISGGPAHLQHGPDESGSQAQWVDLNSEVRLPGHKPQRWAFFLTNLSPGGLL